MKEAQRTVDNPPHYTRSKVQPIDAIEAWELGFHLGNAVKYIARAGHKAGSTAGEDLRKARWYLDRAINNIERRGSDGDDNSGGASSGEGL